MNQLNYILGFQDYQEPEDTKIHICGKIPEWLNGIYLRNGSGKFRLAEKTVNHWFDGLSLINKFQFISGNVIYQSALLNSQEAQYVQKSGALLCDQFGTHPNKSFIKKFSSLFTSFDFTDNTAVNILPIGKQALALTETPHLNLVDIDNLTAVTPVKLTDRFTYQITTAHPKYDAHSKKLINLAVNVGLKSSYYLFEMDLKSYQRSLIGRIPVKNPAYHHSFACTEKYIVLFECPYQLTPLPFFFAMKGFGPAYIENYHWHPNNGTKLIVFDRQKKCVAHEIITEAFFMFHVANSYQQDNELIIDAIIYEDPRIIQQLYLDNIQQGHSLSAAKLTRFKLNLGKNSCTQSSSDQFGCEFPRYNYQYQAKTYHYLYTVGWQEKDIFFNSLLKWDLTKDVKQIWQQANCYPGEPLFIAHPEAKNEDEGVVISIILDAARKISFLLILEARTWTELARVELDHVLPFGLHGNFIKS